MDDPLISIIMPAYNVAPYLRRSVKSALSQTYENIELILVDDGSTDSSGLICDECAASDPRALVIHKKNGGLSSARNAGIDEARGEWLFFIDSDDYIDEEMVESLLANAIANGADMVMTGVRYIGEDGSVLREECFAPHTMSNREFWAELYPPAGMVRKMSTIPYVVSWNKLYKSKLFTHERFDLGKVHEDEYILHRVIDQCEKIATTGLCHYNYLQRSDSIMGRGRSAREALDASESFLLRARYLSSIGLYHEAASALVQSATNLRVSYGLICEATDSREWKRLSKDLKGAIAAADFSGYPIKDRIKSFAYSISPRMTISLLSMARGLSVGNKEVD